jgi:hypothetical protein
VILCLAWPGCEGIREESGVMAIGSPGSVEVAKEDQEEEEEE